MAKKRKKPFDIKDAAMVSFYRGNRYTIPTNVMATSFEDAFDKFDTILAGERKAKKNSTSLLDADGSLTKDALPTEEVDNRIVYIQITYSD